MPKPGIVEVKTGGNASTCSVFENLPEITREVVDFLCWLTAARSGCTEIGGKLQSDDCCTLFHHPENSIQVSANLKQHLINAILSTAKTVSKPLPSSGNSNTSGESANKNSGCKDTSEDEWGGKSPDKSPLLLIGDVIARTKLSKRKICYDMNSGALAYIKLGRATRFDPDDVDAYIEARRVGRKRSQI